MFRRKHKARVLAGITLSEKTVPTTPPPPPPPPFWKQPAVYITLALLPLCYMAAYVVLWPYPGNNYTESTKVQVLTAILAVLAGIVVYWLQTSYSSGKKDDTIAASVPVTALPAVPVVPAPTPPAPPPVQIGSITNEGEKKS